MREFQTAIQLRILLLSSGIDAIETFCHFAQTLSMCIETCCESDVAMKRLCHSKFEGVIVDLAYREGLSFLKILQTLTSNNSAVSFAILSRPNEMTDAFNAGANYVFNRPLIRSAVAQVFRVSYPQMLREKRRYFRYPVELSVVVSRHGCADFKVTSFNLSENGICLNAAESLRVGDRFQMRFHLPGQPTPVVVTGDVCWSEASGRVGIQFCERNAVVAAVLRDWLSERLEEHLLSVRTAERKHT